MKTVYVILKKETRYLSDGTPNHRVIQLGGFTYQDKDRANEVLSHARRHAVNHDSFQLVGL